MKVARQSPIAAIGSNSRWSAVSSSHPKQRMLGIASPVAL
jgi:hypothetical protein